MRNKQFRISSSVITLLIIAIILSGCSSITSGDLIGIWSGSWEYEGKQINSSVQFERNGNYYKVTYRDGVIASTEEGTYVIKGNNVNCQINGNPGTLTPYKYKNGKLVNGGHAFAKEK